ELWHGGCAGRGAKQLKHRPDVAIPSGSFHMGRKMWVFGRIRLLVFALTLLASATAPPAAAAPAVDAVRFGNYPAKTRVVLDLSEAVSFTIFTLADPYRIVIDLPEVDWRLRSETAAPGGRITGYRYGLFRPGQSRVVIDL